MIGTMPMFYKIGVTTAPIEAVQMGMYPFQASIIHKLVPPVLQLEQLEEYGMGPLDNRVVILGCFKAFKLHILSVDQ